MDKKQVKALKTVKQVYDKWAEITAQAKEHGLNDSYVVRYFNLYYQAYTEGLQNGQ